ncbi:arginine--tRNA ligase [Haloimpatiens sp. FM7315]|uniref:arginine--tRNA ligase n=1 Tax=Haloimpatiens sp. FM7315 TaxID=3298609 RepID=UPI0035A28B3E
MDYKAYIAEKIKANVDMDLEEIMELIEIPPKADMGDYAFPCFKLAKVFRKAPNSIAEELKTKINSEGLERIENLGPYLNFFLDKSVVAKEIIEKVLKEGDKYGSDTTGNGKKVVVEYSSPNIAKPFHIGHLSTTVIGHSLYKILNFEGYDVVRINHLGDWGTQFGKLISAYKRWGNEEALHSEPINELLRIYVKFHEEAEKDSSLDDEARMHFKKLEDGCEEETALWDRFRSLSLKEFSKVYNMLGVDFDYYTGESFYNDKMDAIIDDIDKKGLLEESNGARVVMLDKYNMPPCLVKKSDGATIYATRDLAAATYRKKTYDFYKNIYVVGTPQALHFKQIFKTLELMGNEWAKDCVHVGFGLVKFQDRSLSTRKGEVLFLEDLLNQAVAKTLEVINEKNPDLEDKEDVAKKIGIGAVVFAYLKNNRERDIIFDWKDMLNFDGETGPYVQYTYARGKSILRKLGYGGEKIDYSKLNSKEEFELIKLLGAFKDAIESAIDKYEPSIITRYVLEVAKAFNKFYNSYSIANCEDEETKNARLKMVEATCDVVKNALDLIGVNVVEKM